MTIRKFSPLLLLGVAATLLTGVVRSAAAPSTPAQNAAAQAPKPLTPEQKAAADQAGQVTDEQLDLSAKDAAATAGADFILAKKKVLKVTPTATDNDIAIRVANELIKSAAVIINNEKTITSVAEANDASVNAVHPSANQYLRAAITLLRLNESGQLPALDPSIQLPDADNVPDPATAPVDSDASRNAREGYAKGVEAVRAQMTTYVTKLDQPGKFSFGLDDAEATQWLVFAERLELEGSLHGNKDLATGVNTLFATMADVVNGKKPVATAFDVGSKERKVAKIIIGTTDPVARKAVYFGWGKGKVPDADPNVGGDILEELPQFNAGIVNDLKPAPAAAPTGP